MRFNILDKKLAAFYYKGSHKKKFASLEDDIIDVMDQIEAAKDTRDFYALKGLHFEKLKGDFKGKHSMRLNDQFRLIVEIRKDDKGEIINILEVNDYH